MGKDFRRIQNIKTLNEKRNFLNLWGYNLILDSDDIMSEFNELFESYDLENLVKEPRSISNHII